MSGSSRRRHSKWDHKDSEILSEDFHDRAPPRKSREPLSPSRVSRRHEGRSKERMMKWDREGNSTRMSPDLGEWRHRHHSRSPRNGWGRSYRSGSRSRSRSRSPNSRREPELTERSRSKSGVSEQICRDFASGKCRRGNHCQFLHQDAQLYDSRRPLRSSPPDDWGSGHRRSGISRYSPDDTKEYAARSDRSSHVCNDFLKGRCRRGASCRYPHHSAAADLFERGPADDVYRDRDNDHRSRDTYSERNHDREPPKRGETLCKFFAAGNCRNGNRCRFSHQVQEDFSPERRSQDGRRGSDRNFEGSPAWNGPRWSDATRVSNVPAVQGWEEDKNENMEVAKEVTAVRSRDDSWSRSMVDMKQPWDAPASTDEPKTRDDEQPLQWKPESIVPSMGLSALRGTENPGISLSASRGTESLSGDMELSPRDIPKQQGLISHTPSLSNISFPVVQQDRAGEASYEKHYATGFQQEVFNDPYSGRNPNFKEDKAYMYPEEGRNAIGNSDGSCTPNRPLNLQPGPSVFQSDHRVNIQPISSILPPGQGQLPFPLHSSVVEGMQTSTPNPPMIVPPGQSVLRIDQRDSNQPISSANPPAGQGHLPFGGNGMQTSQNPLSDSKVADGQHLTNVNASALPSSTATNHSTVSSEQLAQLTHLSASLAQLLESRQQQQQLPQLSSAVIANGMPNLSDPAASMPPVSGATSQPNQAPVLLKQYDPLCDSLEQKMPNLGNHKLPSLLEQKTSDNEMRRESGDVNQHEAHAGSKDDNNGGKVAEGGSKAPENGPPEDMADDGADDGKKSKDAKGIRPFKFALAEFIKELLKPAWKDGHVNKEAYKTIVKKVVDKVIETQGLQVPQTKEKIDQYLSSSKPKLEKLVQAYVGKYQKS